MSTKRDPAKYRGSVHRWKTGRERRSFRVYVVEPFEYSPTEHDALFGIVLGHLAAPKVAPVKAHGDASAPLPPQAFDLLTFPEAFVSVNGLLESFRLVATLPSLGCVHVGLRPDAGRSHLFSVMQIRSMTDAIFEIDGIVRTDLDDFSNWLDEQEASSNFNVGCMFAVDTEGKLRICLHPKMVRSNFEFSALHESHLCEANLLTVVTLVPASAALRPVTIQPLLCSDALTLKTDVPMRWPMDGFNLSRECLGEAAPEDVDIVSVCTCTPQQRSRIESGAVRRWHEDFLRAFVRTVKELHFHGRAVFVLANYTRISGELEGGASGAFLPVPSSRSKSYPEHVTILSHRKDEDGQYEWSPLDRTHPDKRADAHYTIGLDSAGFDDSSAVRVLGFTLAHIVRDGHPGAADGLIADLVLYQSDGDGHMVLAGENA